MINGFDNFDYTLLRMIDGQLDNSFIHQTNYVPRSGLKEFVEKFGYSLHQLLIPAMSDNEIIGYHEYLSTISGLREICYISNFSRLLKDDSWVRPHYFKTTPQIIIFEEFSKISSWRQMAIRWIYENRMVLGFHHSTIFVARDSVDMLLFNGANQKIINNISSK